jgi:type IV pilus assembly protein PilP
MKIKRFKNKRILGLISILSLLLLFHACGSGTELQKKPAIKKKIIQQKIEKEYEEMQQALLESPILHKGYVYERRGRRDPFEPLIKPKRVKKKGTKIGTLESYDLSDFTLMAIAKKGSEYYALLVTPDNRAFTVVKGMRIGLNNGRVKEITSERVVLVEYSRDYMGELKSRKIILELRKGEGK